MNSYIISYDLMSPSKDYSSLISAIKSYGTYAKVLESCWIIKSSNSSATIRTHLTSYMDSDDKIFVAKLTGEAAWSNVLCTDDWIKNNI